ncbi:MAG: hypothetical protein ACI4IM_01305 [Acutalibacteraceae bacterium]
MDQSTRIKYYIKYNNHPLKNEYEKEKKKIKVRRLPLSRKIIIAASFIPIIMFFVIGYWFFNDIHIVDNLSCFGHTVLYILWGIGNIFSELLPLMFFTLYGAKWIYTDDFKKLKEKYEEKDLIEVDSPFLSSCGEFDCDLDHFVCSVNREPLSLRERKWCSTPGNCRKCARFLTAMGFDTELYDNLEKW